MKDRNNFKLPLRGGVKPEARVLGVVLCGGESRRMGSDKGLLVRDGRCWAAIMGNKLREAGLEVVYSVRGEQEVAYRSALPGAVLVRDREEAVGPLRGVLSVHRLFDGQDLLLVACDMVDLGIDTIRALIANYVSSPGFEFYIYFDGDFAQPFCGVYTAPGLKRLADDIGRGEIAKISFQQAFRKYTDTVMRLSITDPGSFTNYNSSGG